MHVSAKKMATAGLMLALTMIGIYLGSVIETNTLFLLAAASYMVGIIYREMGSKMSTAFLLAATFLGFFLSPNKLYIFSYAGMGAYILISELAYDWLGKRDKIQKKRRVLWCVKYGVFNAFYMLAIFGFSGMLFVRKLSEVEVLVLLLIGQVGLWIYDRAYGYVQSVFWTKIRKRLA